VNQASEESWTILRLLQWTTGYLEGKGAESARLDAELLLAHVRGCPRIELYTDFDQVATDDERTRFKSLVQRRAAGEPVAYLLGQKEFYSRNFEVTPAVLIPRPDTESLVVAALDWLSAKQSSEAASLADIGTGSGVLAITLALKYPSARVFASDIEAEALKVARRNATEHGVDGQIDFVCGSYFGERACGPFDLVVSNPPYVSESEYADLPVSVRDYEPHSALVAGVEGSECVIALLEAAADRVRPGGGCIVEISPMIEAKVKQLIDQDRWHTENVVKDQAGLSRALVLERRG